MEWNRSYYPNYFSIEDILASQERITCKVEMCVYGLGHLDQSTCSKDLEIGTKIELPSWLAVALSTSKRHVVSTQLPAAFNSHNREILSADASVVNLHKLGPYFYETGLHILSISGREADQLAQLLQQVLRDRLRTIMDKALNSLEEDTLKQVTLLDELERMLFKAGQFSFKDHKLWLSGHSHILKVSATVQKNSKRKFSEIS